MNLNKVMIAGNLTRDPELKYTPKGTAVCKIGLAVNRKYTPPDGEPREEVTFIDVEAFGRVAEIIGEYCKKGKPVFIEGRLKLDSWDDKASGQKRSKMKVVIETMQLLGGREEGSGDRGGSSHGHPADDLPQPARLPRLPRPPAPPADPDAAPDDIPF